MYYKKKPRLLAFATKDLWRSAKRFKNQAERSNYFSDVKILSNNDLDNFCKEKINFIINNSGKRGYGYWFWKPYIILDKITKLNEGDILIYTDIGCHIVSNKKRFYEYLDHLKSFDILGFQYFNLVNKTEKKIKFPSREEYKYTKGDLLKYFEFLYNDEVLNSPQFWSGCIFFKKTTFTILFLKEWIKVYEDISLVDDSFSKEKNLNGFIENRHDQSVFSLLSKKYKIKSISAYECDWAEDNSGRNWQYTLNSPILAKRDKKYSIMRRFLNRQTKNLKRVLEYLNIKI